MTTHGEHETRPIRDAARAKTPGRRNPRRVGPLAKAAGHRRIVALLGVSCLVIGADRPVSAYPATSQPIEQSALVTLAGPSAWHGLDTATQSVLAGTAAISPADDPEVLTPRSQAAPARLEAATTAKDWTAIEARRHGPDASAARARARAADRAVIMAQEPVVAAARRLGARVVSRYSAAANGLLVHATDAELAALAKLPGVSAVEPAPRVRLARAAKPPVAAPPPAPSNAPAGPGSAPRAPRGTNDTTKAARLDFDGAGSVVAIIDTGIDYSHADFGGPGTSAAYRAAQAADTIISDTWDGLPLFPSAKVIGGYDFVGANYTSPPNCPPDQAANGSCTSEPHPDLDPLDQHGHGTHVAGIAAGQGTASVPAGVAPGARLVALKIYGPPANGRTDEEVDVVVDAIEWCTRVNMGLDVPGTPPPGGAKIDVINMSLGEDFGQGSRLFDAAATAAGEAGITVVASAGNAGDQPFILGAPGASPAILSVAGADPATVSSANGPSGIDVMAAYSSRGPSRNGALKPNIAAPGTGIQSAARGTGNLPSALSGTSMASPHAAGAAAVIAERNRAEGLGLDGAARAALLMNYALGSVRTTAIEGAPLAPLVRQGSGRVDVPSALAGKVLMRPAGTALASLQLGATTSASRHTLTRTMEIQSLSDEDLMVQPGVVFTSPDDTQGLSVVVPNEPLTLKARRLIRFDVLFKVDPAALPAWLLEGNPLSGAGAYDRQAFEGRLQVQVQSAAGRPLPDEPVPTVPFSLLPRRASALAVAYPAARIPGDEGPAAMAIRNGGFAGYGQLFLLPDGYALPKDDGSTDELGLQWTGVRFETQNGEPRLAFGIAAHRPWSIPQPIVTEAYLDADLDGAPEIRLRLATTSILSGQTATNNAGLAIGISAWDAARGTTTSPERTEPVGDVDLYSRVLIFSVSTASLGMAAHQPFDYYVVRRGYDENWLKPPAQAVAPTGAERTGGPRYRVRPAEWALLPADWATVVADHDQVRVALRSASSPGEGGPLPKLLLLMPQGDLEAPDGQARLVLPTPARSPIYVPLVQKRLTTRPAPHQ